MSFSLELPAPGSLINKAGVLDNVNGEPAPGFSGLNLVSQANTEILLSRSNRGLPVGTGGHSWSFDISYHPMKKETFDSLEAFILGMDTRKNPFYVTLPNYGASKNPAFNVFNTSAQVEALGAVWAGDTTLTLGSGINIPNNAVPYPGDLFNIEDSMNALHKNIYKVTRVETASAHAGMKPAAGKPRIHIYPPIQRDKVGTMTLRFLRPKFRVLQQGNHEVSYDQNNLVSYSLKVTEIMP